jgi:hypothetical protein
MDGWGSLSPQPGQVPFCFGLQKRINALSYPLPVLTEWKLMARPERFELPTSWFVARRSIQLSYGRGGAANSNTCTRCSITLVC